MNWGNWWHSGEGCDGKGGMGGISDNEKMVLVTVVGRVAMVAW